MDTIKVEMSLRFPKKICGDNITQHVNVKVLSQVNHIGPINAVDDDKLRLRGDVFAALEVC